VDDTYGTLTLYVNEFTNAALGAFGNTKNGGDTGSLPTARYTKDGVVAGKRIIDLSNPPSGVEQATIAPAPSTDDAKPFVMMVETGDMVGKVNTINGEDVGNGDGYLDNFLFYMSESVSITVATTVGGFSIDESVIATQGTNAAPANNTFTLIGFDSNANTGAFDLIPVINPVATPTEDNAVAWAYGGVASGQAKLYTTSSRGTFDTGCTPRISYDGTNNVKDVAGLALAVFSNKTTIDKAAPVMVAAVGSVTANEVFVQFSEIISNAVSYANLTGGAVLSNTHFG